MLDNLTIIFRTKENRNEPEKEAVQEKRLKDMEKLMMKQTETISSLSERVGEQTETISRQKKQFQKQEGKFVPVKEPGKLKMFNITALVLFFVLLLLFSLICLGIVKKDDASVSGVFASVLSIASVVIVGRGFSQYRKNIDYILRTILSVSVFLSVLMVIVNTLFDSATMLFSQVILAWFSLVFVGIILVNKLLGDYEYHKYKKRESQPSKK